MQQLKQNVRQYQQAAQEQLTCPDGSVVSINEACPPTDKPLSNCDGSFQDCITPYGDVCQLEGFT